MQSVYLLFVLFMIMDQNMYIYYGRDEKHVYKLCTSILFFFVC